MAKQDEDGFYFLVDRKKGRHHLRRREPVPGADRGLPGRLPQGPRRGRHRPARQAVGEIAAAIIQIKEGMTCTESEINQFCTDLPRYKRPRKIIFAPVPRNATGKIEKPKLREQYCGVRLVEAQNRG